MCSSDLPRHAGRLPHFLVVGAQKAGTSALHWNLRHHPSLELVPRFQSTFVSGHTNDKETFFFNGWGGQSGVRTLGDYKSLFNDNGRLQGEVCPAYSAPEALAAIAKTIPDVRLILICREPVARIESAYNHMMQMAPLAPRLRYMSWRSRYSFEQNVRAELAHPHAFGLVRIGIYADTVSEILSRFSREQLLILVAEEYQQDPQATYDLISSYLGVPGATIAHKDAHVRTYTTRLTAEQRDWLTEFYRPHNERFFELLGRELPSWTRAAGVRT